VLLQYKKNIHKAAITFALLLTCCLSQAQDAKIVFDSTESGGTVDDDEYRDQEDPVYFLPKGDTLSVNQRNVSPEAVRKMKEDKDFWYVDAPLTEKQKRELQRIRSERERGKEVQKGKKESAIEEEDTELNEPPRKQNGALQTLLWIGIVIVFAIGLVMYLGNSNVGLFRKKDRSVASMEEEEAITEDIFAINYQKDIDRAAAAGNFRLAIRLMFLRSLKNMAEKNIIRYKQDKTNFDYLVELHPTAYYNNFFKVTRSYEYSWYGQFPVSEEAYRIIRNDFDQFDKALR
jgi:hypothetical protein